MHNKCLLLFLFTFCLLTASVASGNVKGAISPVNEHEVTKSKILQVNIRDEINAYTWTIVQKSFRKASAGHFDYILLNLNTYGGEVLYADSIRTTILNSRIPVIAFINSNAASAGALVSIACDSIYMRPEATIGASTVVDMSGKAAPEKYQSYMRGIIRATAEAQGKYQVITDGDTILKWRRDPIMAEAMVDPDVYVKDVNDKGKVLTFTANEAIESGYCEGLADNVKDVIEQHIGLHEYNLVVFSPSGVDRIKGTLMGSAIRAILIMLIVAGIWFELQAPGIGFPTLVSVISAVLYFAPLYIEGLAQNWEIIIFIIGFILLFLEFFVIPGFGVAGITGGLCIMFSLVFALIDNSDFDFSLKGLDALDEPFMLVSGSIVLSVAISLWITTKIGKGKGFLRKVALTATQEKEDGFIGVPPEYSGLVGKTGEAVTILRPSGKIRLNGKTYDAVSEIGYIEPKDKVVVNRYESGQLYVTKIQ